MEIWKMLDTVLDSLVSHSFVGHVKRRWQENNEKLNVNGAACEYAVIAALTESNQSM